MYTVQKKKRIGGVARVKEPARGQHFNPLTAGVISHFGTAVRRSKMLISSVGSTICLLLIHLLRYLFDFLRVFSLYPWH